MVVHPLTQDNAWFDKYKYEDAESQLYKYQQRQKYGISQASGSSLVDKIAQARQQIKNTLQSGDCTSHVSNAGGSGTDDLKALVMSMAKQIEDLTLRVSQLEASRGTAQPAKIQQTATKAPASAKPAPPPADDDDDVDLFGSEDDEEANKAREDRLAAYAEKKSKKPAVVAKSSIVLDVKPWDDETDMGEMEKKVRSINMDGLVWGVSKLVPLAFGIKKLQIVCVVEDEKVSIDELSERIEGFEDYVQSVDIAAFNKI